MKQAFQVIIGAIVILILIMLIAPGKVAILPSFKDLKDKVVQIKMPDLPAIKIPQTNSEEKQQAADPLDLEDKLVKAEGVLQEKDLNLNNDQSLDKALIVKVEEGLKLMIMAPGVNEEKILAYKEGEQLPVLVKQKFSHGDTLILVKKHGKDREKIKIVLKKNKLLVGGYINNNSSMKCDLNFLNKTAIIDGKSLNHKEKVSSLANWQDSRGEDLCLAMKQSLPEALPIVEEKVHESIESKIKEEAPSPIVVQPVDPALESAPSEATPDIQKNPEPISPTQ